MYALLIRPSRASPVVATAPTTSPTRVGHHVLRRMMDGVDEQLVTTAEPTLRHAPFVGGVEEVRLRSVGHRLWADVDISVDPELPLGDAQQSANLAEHALYHELPQLAAATTHTHPRDADGTVDAHAAVRHRRPRPSP